MKAPTNITVERRGVRYTASWSDDEFDFHIWLNVDRTLQEGIIYKNRKATRGQRDHRTGRCDVAKHRKVLAAILAIPSEAFDKADKQQRLCDETEAAKARLRRIAELQEEAAKLGFKLEPLA